MARRNQLKSAAEAIENVEVEVVVNPDAVIGTETTEETTEETVNEELVQEVIQEVKDDKPGTNPILRDYDLDVLREQLKTKSAVIRFLDSRGYKRADIAKALGLLYQHVRNVLTQPVKTDRAAVPNPELARRAQKSGDTD